MIVSSYVDIPLVESTPNALKTIGGFKKVFKHQLPCEVEISGESSKSCHDSPSWIIRSPVLQDNELHQ